MNLPLTAACLGLFSGVLLAGLSCAQPARPDAPEAPRPPVRVVIVGATHAHVGWILGRPRDLGDIEIVGLYEPNTEYAERLMKRYKLDPALHFTDLDVMFDKTEPEAACLFGSIFDHRDHTIACAEHGIHVMVEKPLAVNREHARAMAEAAKEHNIELMTNYETTWYPANHALHGLATKTGKLGGLRRIVVQTGHGGPIEIGCEKEFLDWLTDPELNGGGALTDFGCYGANLTTWLMQGKRPTAVSAVTRTLKPDKYPDVDDDATIIVEYDKTVAVIQASWNWTMNRKDMSVYGTDGYAETVGNDRLRIGMGGAWAGEAQAQPGIDPPYHDPFAMLAAVARGEAEPDPLSSLENNLVVVEILDAARESARTGNKVVLED